VLEERAGGGRGEEALLETVDAAISTSITWQRSMEKERGGVTIEIQRDEIRQMIIFDDVRETDQACLADQTP
jgi:outer membrane lipoprotein SlyB